MTATNPNPARMPRRTDLVVASKRRKAATDFDSPSTPHFKPAMQSLPQPLLRLPAVITFSTMASALAFALCTPLMSRAAEPASKNVESHSESAWGLGVAAISTQKPYTGIDRDNLALPLIYFENDRMRVFGTGVEF